MKKILIFGATGNLGRKIVQKAVTKDWDITIFTRPSSSTRQLPVEKLKIIQGDIRMPENVNEAFRIDPHLVISSIGPGQKDDNTVYSGMQNIVNAMNRSSSGRLIAVGGAGILEDGNSGLVMEREDFPPFLRKMASDHYKAWQFVHEALVDYVYLCPGRMYEGDFEDAYKVSSVGLLPNAIQGISYEACADFIIEEALNPHYKREKISIAAK